VSLLVLDVSVAAKWALPPAGETLVDEALRLLDEYESGDLQFVVPDLFWAEFGNVMWKAVRQGRLSEPGAMRALEAMQSRNFPTRSSQNLMTNALRIAVFSGRTFYDCIYVSLALETNAVLLTADERLANALGAHLPVRWLGSFA